MKLWYKKPSENWNEALPIGNGRLGGMIFGRTGQERIQLNEDSVWYGEPIDRNNKDALMNLSKLRKLIFEGKIAEAEKLAVLAFSGTPESQRNYQTLGDLFIDFENDSERDQITNYTRELDMDTGTVKVSYTAGDTIYSRQYFSSFDAQVIVIHLTADKPASISLTARLRRGRYLDISGSPSGDTIIMKGSCGGGKAVKFCTMLSALNDNGQVETIGENLIVRNADAVTLFISATTTFRYEDYAADCRKFIEEAKTKSYNDLLQEHITDYKSLFERVEIWLLGKENKEALELLTTEERLERVKQGEDDPKLVSMYFQFGRYLLIACSRPGTLPATLQGLWNEDMLPPWDSKYTININTEMNYWPAEICNLPECHTPLFEHIERMRAPGRITAKTMYGCRGFMCHHNTDIWGDTAPQDIYMPSTYWTQGAAWLCLHLWEHYEFCRDIEFLRRVYPTIKEASEFYIDFLIEDQKGRLVTCPSVSPENTYRLPNGDQGCICSGPSMDSQILFALFGCVIEAGKLLNCDEDFILQIEHMRERLPKPEVGKYGQLLEWVEDYEEMEPGHRHISHLFGLFPGNQLTLRKTPELVAAARKTLEIRLEHGGGHTGWSRAWIINMWARLQDKEKAYENVMELLKISTLPNLLDNHPPFQIDGNFGGTAGIAEMLLQSHEGEIDLLPVLPDQWSEGCIKGIRARGGFTLDVLWKNNKLEFVKIKSSSDTRITIRYSSRVIAIDMTKDQELSLNGELVRVE